MTSEVKIFRALAYACGIGAAIWIILLIGC
jgi:hypothetical protein